MVPPLLTAIFPKSERQTKMAKKNLYLVKGIFLKMPIPGIYNISKKNKNLVEGFQNQDEELPFTLRVLGIVP